ncbi:MAG: ABC transporter permease [Verrucomicrobiota bacterium]|jgi:ABC-2 type transport system permease protein
MLAYWTLVRRELGAYFLSLTGYVIIAAALFLMGYSFVVMLEKLQHERTSMPVTELFYNTEYFWLILLPTTPLVTMRLFAQEKFSGTFETLMTTPVKDLEVVLAKFTAALMFYTVMWLPLLGCMLVVRRYTHDPSALDAGVLSSTFLGILLLGAMFVALGCFASALTRNQAVAAMISLVFGVGLFLLAFLADRFTDAPQWQAQVLACFTLFDQMHDFARGVVDTRAVVLYASLTLFFLFLTLRVVESRRWK